MNREKMNDAFSQVGAGEELRRSVMEMKVEEKHTVKWNGKKLAVRLASLAAVAVMVGLFFLPGPPVVIPDPDSTGQTQVVQKPLLGIRVHAEEGVIDLGEERDGPILAGEESTDADGDLGLFYKPYEVKIFNTETGEWELYHKKETERMPKIAFEISWEGLIEKYDCHIRAIANGREVDFTKERKNYFLTWIGHGDRGMVGWLLTCSLAEETEVEIIIYDEDTNQTLKMVKMRITPAFYEKQTEGGDSIDPSIGTTYSNEGYMVEVLEEFMIDLTKEE